MNLKVINFQYNYIIYLYRIKPKKLKKSKKHHILELHYVSYYNT